MLEKKNRMGKNINSDRKTYLTSNFNIEIGFNYGRNSNHLFLHNQLHNQKSKNKKILNKKLKFNFSKLNYELC